MTASVSAIEKQARKLSAQEQERLAERILAQIEGEGLTAVDEAWVSEAERRFSAWERKKTKGLPVQKAIAEIRKSLRR